MKKIATPQDLQAELTQILAYSQSERPERGRIAAKLNDLADRLEGTSKTAMDSEEEELYDAIWMIASNDGDSYRKKDAKGAVKKAWAEWQKLERQRNNENWRGIQRKLEADLAKRWAKGEV